MIYIYIHIYIYTYVYLLWVNLSFRPECIGLLHDYFIELLCLCADAGVDLDEFQPPENFRSSFAVFLGSRAAPAPISSSSQADSGILDKEVHEEEEVEVEEMVHEDKEVHEEKEVNEEVVEHEDVPPVLPLPPPPSQAEDVPPVLPLPPPPSQAFQRAVLGDPRLRLHLMTAGYRNMAQITDSDGMSLDARQAFQALMKVHPMDSRLELKFEQAARVLPVSFGAERLCICCMVPLPPAITRNNRKHPHINVAI
jgi:hypothetical protein